jgi:hypothetical protein
MYLPTDLEKQLPPKEDGGLGGLVIFPKKVDFGVIRKEGIYCIPLVVTMRPGDNYSGYMELVRFKHMNIFVSDV